MLFRSASFGRPAGCATSQKATSGAFAGAMGIYHQESLGPIAEVIPASTRMLRIVLLPLTDSYITFRHDKRSFVSPATTEVQHQPFLSGAGIPCTVKDKRRGRNSWRCFEGISNSAVPGGRCNVM